MAHNEVERRPAVIVDGRSPEVVTNHATPGGQIIACSRVRTHQAYGRPSLPRTDLSVHAHQQLAAARVSTIDNMELTSSAHALSILCARANALSTAAPVGP